MRTQYDALVIGGGLAGNCLALALEGSGLEIAMVEAQSREQLQNSWTGDRALALAAGTVTMLDALGAWQGVSDKAAPIEDIHVSDRGHFGKTRLSAKKEGVKALGYVIKARDIESHVADLVERTGVVKLCPARLAGLASTDSDIGASLKYRDESITLTAKLLIGADGGNSSVRKLLDIGQQTTEYGQTALVTTVNCSLPHRNTAFERFTVSGPLALLPIEGNQCAVVWTNTHRDAESLMSVSDEEFIERLQECFGYRLGELSLAAPRRAFPLTLVQAETMVKGRAVIIGNAVHQLHPVAGQGFNLGLRDVVQLAEMLIEQAKRKRDIGDSMFLRGYAQARRKDLNKIISFTDNVVRIFSNDWIALAAARNLGLALLDTLPGGKSLLTRHAMGLAGRLPRVGNRR
ncbi:MAG: 2-octaprenyl-6-methoxyphenyl hydroxylase [Gammaproteobacteria bacterium HGW-Gammaproteobacteria-10]|nr:MAG: 2-octaprenyl-6-methoxyphenyl hydroxylase [Gammaproteobacteria bacterium HGW-Gammaproteobacteria-10]